MHKSLITPPEIESLAGQVLRQLQGQTYVNAMYALEVAQRQLASELTKLTDQHVFRPSSSQCSPPAGASVLPPGEVGALCTSPPPQPTTAAV